jgi:hypothetical protein
MEELPETKRRKLLCDSGKSKCRYRGIIIWDIDDTLLISLNAAMKRLQEQTKVIDKYLISNVDKHLLDFLDENLFFSKVDHIQPVEHIRDWATIPDLQEALVNIGKSENLEADERSSPFGNDPHSSKLTPKVYADIIRKKYIQTRNTDVNSIISNNNLNLYESAWSDIEKYKKWKMCTSELEKISGGWTSKAKLILNHLALKGCRNIIVTASELISAYAKLIMWELTDFFDFDDVYSSVNRPKTEIFLKILEDLGRSGCSAESMAACGDSNDEATAARTFSIPFQHIRSALDLFLVPGLLGDDLIVDIPKEELKRP